MVALAEKDVLLLMLIGTSKVYPPSVQRVAFFEKMNQLNTTMWIGNSLLKSNDIKNISSLAYGILIDGDRDSSTGKEGVTTSWNLNGLIKLVQ